MVNGNSVLYCATLTPKRTRWQKLQWSQKVLGAVLGWGWGRAQELFRIQSSRKSINYPTLTQIGLLTISTFGDEKDAIWLPFVSLRNFSMLLYWHWTVLPENDSVISLVPDLLHSISLTNQLFYWKCKGRKCPQPPGK